MRQSMNGKSHTRQENPEKLNQSLDSAKFRQCNEELKQRRICCQRKFSDHINEINSSVPVMSRKHDNLLQRLQSQNPFPRTFPLSILCALTAHS